MFLLLFLIGAFLVVLNFLGTLRSLGVFLLNLGKLLKFEQLLLLLDLVLLHSLHEFVRVGHDLWNQMVLVVILKVVYFLEVLVVLLGYSFNVCYQRFILKIQAPVFSVIISAR